eukprot:2872722-Lingulodinium_polyedra.AAC.1
MPAAARSAATSSRAGSMTRPKRMSASGSPGRVPLRDRARTSAPRTENQVSRCTSSRRPRRWPSAS